MYNFEYYKPNNTTQAIELLGTNEENQLLAGGMTLIPALKHRLASPSSLIDIGGITELRGIQLSGDQIIVGATTRHADVATSEIVSAHLPALGYLAGTIGDPQVRNRGTIGGSIANNDPAADYPAAVLGLGATIVTNRREIVGDKFFLGIFETALEDDEIVEAVRFPIPLKAGYSKHPNPASHYAIVGVFIAKMPQGDVRVAVTGAGSCVFRISEMEETLTHSLEPQSIVNVRVSPNELNEDIHASAAYRAHLINVMARRTLLKLA